MKLQTVSTQDLGWSKERKTLSCEASSVFGLFPDTKFFVESHHTGKIKMFEQVETVRDQENDIVLWKYECRSDPSIKMVVFND